MGITQEPTLSFKVFRLRTEQKGNTVFGVNRGLFGCFACDRECRVHTTGVSRTVHRDHGAMATCQVSVVRTLRSWINATV